MIPKGQLKKFNKENIAFCHRKRLLKITELYICTSFNCDNTKSSLPLLDVDIIK